jgi:hypothetical protein
MWALRVVGGLLLFLAVVCVLLIWLNWHTASLGGRDLKPLALPAVIFCLLGIGLLLRRKSAAVMVVFGSIAWATWMIVGTARQVPMPWALYNMAAGVLVLVPAGVILAKWRALVRW